MLRLTSIRMDFFQGGETLHVLRGVDLEIERGEVVALVGPSGSGKSTLLHLAGLLEAPTSGEVMIGDVNASGLADRERTLIRRNELGFVYQFHHLLPEFTALENIVLPQLIAGVPKRVAEGRAHELLELVGLTARARHRPAQLSGGEQQRVAFMRALANRPKVLLADEPTGNLDDHTAELVMSELMKLAKDTGVATLIATHNRELASRMNRCMQLREGQLHPIDPLAGGE
ncbi:ABC transporter ATP-binding protein [Govanella unica]|uniref:ABC transporter ATP-binding protein n=1 Tax=Govanella unica TaxID=2975056 RepID=A0A9X3TXG2_9PROT|nr:ABC transporter ATP-binding protein [Govania unica]MDA5193761.1 ABC transporter ATP-binding protein [Govania unica]